MDADDEAKSYESLYLDAEDNIVTNSAETGNTPSDSNSVSNPAPPSSISSEKEAGDTNSQDNTASINTTANPIATNIEAVADETTKVSADTIEEVQPLSQESADKSENLPATPPATPITNGEQPLFPSQTLITTPETDKDDSVSIPASDKPDLTSNAAVNSEDPKSGVTKTDLPPTPIESIAAPFLEAATIVHAVAGISISDPSTPVPISTPTGTDSSEVSFSPLVSSAQTMVVELQTNVAENKVAPAPQVSGSLPVASIQTSEATAKKVRDDEVELLRARVQTLEAELVAALSKPGTKNHVLVETIKQQHEELLSKARGMLFDKTKIVKNQELQIEALNAQVASLKDVNSITKDLLEIRNSEIKHLEERMNSMEERFKHEKERHMLVLKRAETGQSINNDLKTEYEGQLKIFKELREMYDQRVQALTAENKRLNDSIEATKAQLKSEEQ